MPGLVPGIHDLRAEPRGVDGRDIGERKRRRPSDGMPAMTAERAYVPPAFFTASARLAFADPGLSGCCWLACGAQPESQMMSNVARMRPSASAKRSAKISAIRSSVDRRLGV